jgi:hypothetical protein
MKKEVFHWRDGTVCVCVTLWINFIAGDTSGHNNLVGHMNGGQPKFIYWDCKCLFDELSSPIPMCFLIEMLGEIYLLLIFGFQITTRRFLYFFISHLHI